MSHGGPCIVGKRTFADVNGNLFPCERVSESSKAMKIGNIYTGFDFEKADKIMNVARLTENECKQCWAISRCYMCAKYADNGEELCAENKLQECENVRLNLDYDLRKYIALKEIKAGGAI